MIRSRLVPRFSVLIAVIFPLFALHSTVIAQPTVKREPARPIRSNEGKAIYNAYCAACHGVDAKGHGPAAPALKVPPTDLTTYAKRHDGKFSEVALQEIIQNEQAVTAHGSSEMPVWGDVFRALETSTELRKLKMHNLIEYIRTLQAK